MTFTIFLQGILVKRTNPKLIPTFTKDPFYPSCSNEGQRVYKNMTDILIENISRKCEMQRKVNWQESDLRKFYTFSNLLRKSFEIAN